MHDRVGAAEPALGRAPLVLLQALRELDRQVNLGTEKQWSCGDAIVTSGHLLGKHFPKVRRSYGKLSGGSLRETDRALSVWFYRFGKLAEGLRPRRSQELCR